MDELLTKQVPQSLEAEQSVLGSMLIDERCVPDVIGLLLPDDFYLQQNRDIYETIYTMFNFSQHIDPVTVLDKMKERGVYDEAHSYDYIAAAPADHADRRERQAVLRHRPRQGAAAQPRHGRR